MIAIGIGINPRTHTLDATALTADCVDSRIKVEDLYRYGLPQVANTQALRFVTDFAHWSEASPLEYLEALGTALPSEVELGHQVFQTSYRDLRVVVPALALLRAFFSPTRWLLSSAFRPQVLDQTCRLVPSSEGLSVKVHAQWATKSREVKFRNWEAPLRWMSAYPSAFTMANSVHQMALKGEIGLTLPKANALMVLHGRRLGSSFYVTRLVMSRLTPLEEPYIGFESQPSCVVLHDNARVEGGSKQTQKTVSFQVPRHLDNSVALTDSEWTAVFRLLAEGAQKNAVRSLERNRYVGLQKLFKQAEMHKELVVVGYGRR